MAGIAISRRGGKFSAGVTLSALRLRMRSCQLEIGFIVVECSRFPRSRAVTGYAVMIEISRNMIRIGRSGKICLMAGITIAWRPGKPAVCVTGYARYCSMRSGKRKTGSAVIKC